MRPRLISRRQFTLGVAAFLGGGFAVGYWLRQPGPNPLLTDGTAGHAFNAYVKIGEDGLITVAVPRAEMGQGIQTALAALVAEELDVDLTNVRVEHPLPSKHYINRKLLPEGVWFVYPKPLVDRARGALEFASAYFDTMQLTGGSTSVVDAWDPMRRAGAAAREMLVRAAGEMWDVNPAALQTERGMVRDPASGRELSYGALARAAASVVLPHQVDPKPPGRYRLIGTRLPRVDTADKINGTAIFGLDVKKADMLYAAVRSAPTLSGEIESYDQAAAAPQHRVIKVDAQTIAVVGDSYWSAQRSADRLKVTFKDQDVSLSSKGIYANFKSLADGDRPGSIFRDKLNAIASVNSQPVVQADYWAPYLAHACMEPLNCTAVYAGGKCELWLGTQAPALMVQAVADALGLTSDAVKVNTLLLGGGFGRRLEVDIAVQAARIAKEVSPRPVKLIWSREHDMQRDVFRPAAYIKFHGTLGANKMPDSLFARVCCQSLTKNYIKRNLGWPFPLPDKTNVEGLFDQPYAIEPLHVEHVEAENIVPVGNWRSVGHSFNGFAMECFLDELATEGKQDPFEVRRYLLKNHANKVALLDRLHDLSGWGKKPDNGHGRGMAYRCNFGSDVAQVVDVAIENEKVKVKRVFCVIDCGQPVDCAGIEAQVQSGIVFGLSAALMQATTIENGAVQQKNFNGFDALRIYECPEIKIAILNRNEEISGVGEAAVPPVAPALANAVFDATRERVHELPIRKVGPKKVM